MKDLLQKRLILTTIGFLGLFLIILTKAFFIQVIDREKLISYSKGQTLRTVTIYPNRGAIFDRHGGPLALNLQAYNLFIIPKGSKNLKRELLNLSKIVPELTYKKLLLKTNGRKRYTWLARKLELTKDQVRKVKGLNEVYIESTPKRFYPNNELLGQVLGHVGHDNKGLAGLEYRYDDYLKGRQKSFKYLKDAKGRPVRFGHDTVKEEGGPLYLTIDKNIQAMSEKYLKWAVLNAKAKRGGIGVMDAYSGEILAMAHYPQFNPNRWQKEDEYSKKISFISDPFEPGSILKTLTVTSGLENNIIRPDTNYYCERGRLKVEDHIIKEAYGHTGHEWLSVTEILMHSSNIGTTKIAFDLGHEKLFKTLDEFNIGKRSQIELPGESRGIFKKELSMGMLSLSNISFGQGVAATPLQMLAAYSALVNDGIYNAPTIIHSQKNNFSGQEKKARRVTSSVHAREIKTMLYKTVEEGTGQKAKIPFFKIAGKTSTAQKASNLGKYENYISSFIGFPINVDRPFVIYIYIDEPKTKKFGGGDVAAPVFRKLGRYILYKNKEFSNLAMKGSNKSNLFDKVGTRLSALKKVNLNRFPSFIGLDKKSVMLLSKKYKLQTSIQGIGLVKKQIPSAGELIGDKRVVKLVFYPPTYDEL